MNDEMWEEFVKRTDLSEKEYQNFFKDLCDLIEEHGEQETREMVQLIKSLEHFRDDWLDSFGATGALWHMED